MGKRAIILGIILSGGSHAFAGGLPELPDVNFNYFDYAVTDLPTHFYAGRDRSVVSHDNTPSDNKITDAGANLGRVLFYDTRLSHNNSTACASCHVQETGFADPNQFSVGFQGEETPRHSMALTNSKFYANGRMFWDERASSLEEQVLQPIQDEIEMGMDLDALNSKLQRTEYYDELFEDAFGDNEVTSERISLALAQFVRSMVSYNSEFDAAFNGNELDLGRLSESAQRGHAIFSDNCASCHTTNAQIARRVANNGLDAVTTDEGAGDGEFKAPSLRNVEVRAGYMHDGRFATLREVLEFYNSGIQDNPDLDRQLERRGGTPERMNLSDEDLDDLEEFLNTLTDETFLTSEMFADPFNEACDFDQNGTCDTMDLDEMFTVGSLLAAVQVTSGGNELYDLNGDSVIDSMDLQQWLDIAGGDEASYLQGDANLDGNVDFSDFLVLSTNFGSSAGWAGGDFDGSGEVGFSDFLQLSTNFGSYGSIAAVPEPEFSPLGIILMAAISTSLRSRARYSAQRR